MCTGINSKGKNTVVEIDELHLFKRKYHRGRILVSESVWLIGGICRETKEVFLQTAVKRDKETLFKIISENVLPKTTIITDCWKAYNILDAKGWTHLTVNHSYNFVCPENSSVHTQTWKCFGELLRNTFPLHQE